jgi:iron complex transport system ATP-binding protein
LHDLGLACRFADRFLLLNDSRIAADGTPEEVLRAPDTGRAYGVEIDIQRTPRGELLVNSYLH